MDRKMTMTPFIVLVMCALRVKDRYLLMLRPQKSYSGDTLSFPGGKVDLEDAQNVTVDVLREACFREFHEEMGVDLKAVKGFTFKDLRYIQAGYFYAAPKDIHALNVLFLVEMDEQPTLSPSMSEVAQTLWLTESEIQEHPKTPAWLFESLKALSVHN